MKKLLTFALVLALCAALLCASAAADDEAIQYVEYTYNETEGELSSEN